MDEYISKMDAIKAVGHVETVPPSVSDAFFESLRIRNEVITSIRSLSPADVVTVIRCKDCKHSRMPSLLTQKYGKPGTLTCCNGPCNRRNVGPDDFCSYGEKR